MIKRAALAAHYIDPEGDSDSADVVLSNADITGLLGPKFKDVSARNGSVTAAVGIKNKYDTPANIAASIGAVGSLGTLFGSAGMVGALASKRGMKPMAALTGGSLATLLGSYAAARHLENKANSIREYRNEDVSDRLRRFGYSRFKES